MLLVGVRQTVFDNAFFWKPVGPLHLDAGLKLAWDGVPSQFDVV